MQPTVAFLSNEPKGYLIYTGPEGTMVFGYNKLSLEHLLEITIPGKEKWIPGTGIDMMHRKAVLDFVGQYVAGQQKDPAVFRIKGNSLVIDLAPVPATVRSNDILAFLGWMFIAGGSLMLVFNVSFTGTLDVFRSGWKTSTISGIFVVCVGIFLCFHKKFKWGSF